MADPTYNEVLQAAVEFAGEVYADDAGDVVLTREREAFYRNTLSTHLRLVWNRARWPELIPEPERRYFADEWDGAETAIETGDIRYVADSDGVPTYYVALQDQATAVAVTDAAFWAATTDFVHRVPKAQTGKTEIGTPLVAHYPSNPDLTPNTKRIPFKSDSAGWVWPVNYPYIWLTYRTAPPRLTAATVGDGTTLTIPERLSAMVALWAAATVCRGEAKADRAKELESLANTIFEDELANVTAFADQTGDRLTPNQ